MASAMKITKFLGIAPKLASELLPDTSAQIARNVNFYSGNLVAYTQPTSVGFGNAGTVKTLYALRDPATDEPVFLTWLTDVDTAVASVNENKRQRFYFTGSGVPKVSDYDLITTGTPPYPDLTTNSYDLGLPLPDTTISVVETPFNTKSVVSFTRASDNTVTVVCNNHGLKTGSTVSLSGFTYLKGEYNQAATSNTVTVTINNHGLVDGETVPIQIFSGDQLTSGSYVVTVTGTNTFTIESPRQAFIEDKDCGIDLRGLNISNAEVTVLDDNTFTYFSPGYQIGSVGTPIPYSQAKVDLGGLTQNRTYVYTYMTPWGEESIASEPSDDLFIKEGVVVTLTGGLPTSNPELGTFIRGLRIYRTVSSASGTDYFRLATLWFPNTVTQVERTGGNTNWITTEFPHNVDSGDKVKITGVSVASFNATGVEVDSVIDDYTFTYVNAGSNVAPTSVSGVLTIDVSQIPGESDPQYWGDGGDYTYVDESDVRLLQESLVTDNYDRPPPNLQGLVSYQNNVLAGFVDNQVYFSEPNEPHAWPFEYRETLEHAVVGLASISGSLLVLTDSYPYLIQGNDPAAGLSVQRIDLDYPCLNRKSIVVMYGAVVWATHGGLAVYAPSIGAQLITKFNFNNLTWQEEIDPSTITAVFYRDKYFASHSTGAFLFERDDENGGVIATTDVIASAGWFDSVTDRLYLIQSDDNQIIEWNSPTEPRLVYRWKSKTFKTQDMVNIGAARVIADYRDVDENATTDIWDEIFTNWEDTVIDTYSSPGSLTFNFYVDKELIYSNEITDDKTFRLPTGYRSDTFEVEVISNLRIREIHLAETPIGLKAA